MKQDTDQSIWVTITEWAKERRVVRNVASASGDVTLTLSSEDKVALTNAFYRIMRQEEDHRLRITRRNAKALGRQLAKAGQRIYDLRCQLEEARSLNTKLDRHGYRNLYSQYLELIRDNAEKIEKHNKLETVLADKLMELGMSTEDIVTMAKEVGLVEFSPSERTPA